MLKFDRDTRRITFTSRDDIAAISETLKFIDDEAEKFGTSPREAAQIRIMCEESLVKLLEYSSFDENSSVTAEISAINFLGNVRFSITIPGQRFDFLNSIHENSAIDSDEVSPEIGEALNNVLLQRFSDRLKYDHNNGVNYIKIAALSSPYNALFKIAAAILLAIAAGIFMRMFASPDVCDYVKTSLLEPASSLVMNALKMCTIPLVFFSVVLCIVRFGSLADMKRVALRSITCFVAVQIVTAVLTVAVFFALRPAMKSAAGILAGMAGVGDGAGTDFFSKIFRELVPPSFLEPFLANDVPKLLTTGIIFGFALRRVNSRGLRYGFEEFNTLLVKALDIVMKFAPVVVFCSITRQILELGFSALANMMWLAVCIVLCEISVVGAYCLAVRVLTGMRVRRFMRDAGPAMLMSASVISDKASIPTNMNACEKLGVPPNIYSISVPMSTIFNKQGNYISSMVSALFLAMMCGIDFTVSGVMLLALQAILIVIAASGITAMLIVPVLLGVPVVAVELVLGVTAMLDITGVALDSAGASASAVIIAGREGLKSKQ